MKIAYCGYDFFHGCLRSLIADGHEILKVFTFDCDNRNNFNRYIYEICEQHQLPITQAAISTTDVKQLDEQGCELLITAGYRYKVPDMRNLSMKGINVHPTLLPLGRGVWPLPWIILTQQVQSGVSIHKLTPEYDAGDVLWQMPFELTADENLESLSCKTQMVAIDALAAVMQNFDSMWYNAKSQDNHQASVWPMPQRSDRTIQWNTSVNEIDSIGRAFGKLGAYAFFDDQWWCVYDLRVWPQIHRQSVGQVVHKSNTEMVVAAADGYVCLRWFERLIEANNIQANE
jgi:methionyl-tRNA formyltransferase